MNFSGRIDTPQQVLRHPSNDSSAKHHWTFSKAARFPNQKNNTNIASYSLPSGKSNRHSGIGFGDRSKNFDGVNLNHPPPTKYDLSSDFDQKKSKGHNFGLNRENIRFANYLKQMEATPAAYEINESLVKHTRSYSLRPKTAYPSNCIFILKQISYLVNLKKRKLDLNHGQGNIKLLISSEVVKIIVARNTRQEIKGLFEVVIDLANVFYK
jgi:hypothetical protein